MSNKIMFAIIVAVLFAVRIYSNSVHCLPNSLFTSYSIQHHVYIFSITVTGRSMMKGR